MRPEWFLHDEIPYDSMWPDDYLWYPKMLKNQYFDGYFKFEGMNKMLEHNITDTTSSKAS
jgi:hypothetical protein